MTEILFKNLKLIKKKMYIFWALWTVSEYQYLHVHADIMY